MPSFSPPATSTDDDGPHDPVARQDPLPFRQFILKIASRCNLKCNYCYMFEMADDSWRGLPKLMSQETVTVAADRIAEHVAEHSLSSVQIILHGGEPLLAGAKYIDTISVRLRNVVNAAVDLRVQTNGTLISNAMLDVLSQHDIRIGVSLDGDQHSNDLHRQYPNGRGSYETVARSLRRIRAHSPQLLAGILCTINLANDPVATYEALQDFEPPIVDFLLPHGNWTSPPPGRDLRDSGSPYGIWLATVFDHWYSGPPERCRVRMFSEIIHVMLGGQAAVETIGLSPVGLIVINSDGSLEQVDTLRSAYKGAVDTGLNIYKDDLNAAALHPDVLARQRGRNGLSDVCQQCPLHTVCGGGLYSHRYKSGHGFMNPSVYCPDLSYLIRHIYRRISDDVTKLKSKDI